MLLYTVIKALALPPGLQVVCGLLGLALYPRHRRSGFALLGVAILSLWAMAMPVTSYWCARSLERFPALDLATLPGRSLEAIVILGGGGTAGAPEYGGESVKPLTLERLRYGAHLHRLTGLPLAVSGGRTLGLSTSEAELMRNALEQDFAVPVRWLERASLDTAENASLSRAAFPFTHIVLVTHALHMRRAKLVFEQAGFSVTPAPLGFVAAHALDYQLTDFVPSLGGLTGTYYALYEYLGACWYRLRAVLPG